MAKRGSYLKGEERREEILASAVDVIAAKGFHGATLRAVGRELGIEPAHILYYFGSREGLMRAVVERWDAANAPEPGSRLSIAELLTAAVRRNQRIRGLVQMHLALAIEATADGHEARNFYADRFALTTSALAAELRDGQAAGVVRPEVDPDRSARQLIALADGLQLQWLIDDSIDVVADLEAAAEILYTEQARTVFAS